MSDSSPERIERLLQLGMIAVRRNKRGRITVAQFKSDAGSDPVRPTAHMGVVYSFHANLGNCRVWEHKRMVGRQDVERLFGETVENAETLDRYVRAIFRAVPLSCMAAGTKETKKTKKTSTVISIDSAREYRRPVRPIEFDSERRAA